MAKNKRACPALGEWITSARCGEERGEQIACPEDCEFNPFSPRNYDDYFQLEKRVLVKTLERHRREAGEHAHERLVRGMLKEDGESFLEHSEVVRVLFLRARSGGSGFMDQWREARYSGMIKDERRIAEAMAGVRLALLEIHRQIDEKTLEVVDLLEAKPEPFYLIDRAMANSWVRFQTMLTWVYQAPHFSRVHTTGLVVDDAGNADPEQAIAAVVSFLGGPTELRGASAWMAEHLKEIVGSHEATRVALRRRMLESLDARRGVADYRWSGNPGVRELSRRLESDPEFDLGDLEDAEVQAGWTQCWDLIRSGKADAGARDGQTPWGFMPPQGEVLVGQVLVGVRGVEAAAQGTENYAEIKARLERLAGDMIVFESEQIDDEVKKILEREKLDYNEALVPPVLLEAAKKLELGLFRLPPEEEEGESEEVAMMRAKFNEYADCSIPLLDDRTPRQAAGDPQLRPRLVRLMKRQLRELDERLADKGGSYDANWLVEELGLHEILFPAPPSRQTAALQHGESDEPDGLNQGEVTGGEARLAASRVMNGPEEGSGVPRGLRAELSQAEIERRWKALADPSLNPPRPNLEVLSGKWPEIAGLALQVRDELGKDEIGNLLALMLLCSEMLCPRRPSGHTLDEGRWMNYLVDEESRILDLKESAPEGPPEALFSGDSPQPHLAHWMSLMVLETGDVAPDSRRRKERGGVGIERMLLMICAIRALIRELSHPRVEGIRFS